MTTVLKRNYGTGYVNFVFIWVGAATIALAGLMTSVLSAPKEADETNAVIGAVCLGIFSLFLFTLPLIIARLTCHQSRTAIVLFTWLLGWSGIGWIAALIWALSGANARVAQLRESDPTYGTHIKWPGKVAETALSVLMAAVVFFISYRNKTMATGPAPIVTTSDSSSVSSPRLPGRNVALNSAPAVQKLSPATTEASPSESPSVVGHARAFGAAPGALVCKSVEDLDDLYEQFSKVEAELAVSPEAAGNRPKVTAENMPDQLFASMKEKGCYLLKPGTKMEVGRDSYPPSVVLELGNGVGVVSGVMMPGSVVREKTP